MDKEEFLSQGSDSINSPFWTMGNMNAIPFDLIFNHNDFDKNIRPDWIEYAENRVLSRKEIDLSISYLVRRHLHYIENIFLNESPVFIAEFLAKELQQLKLSITKDSFRYYKQKILKYEKLEKKFPVVTITLLKERCFWYQRLNMFIFGVSKFGIGSRYVYTLEKNLKELLEENRISYVKRKKLVVAYSHIFFNDKHRSIDYQNTLEGIKLRFLKFKPKSKKVKKS